jgi:hypothetical protein
MATRNQIATYIPKGSLESAGAADALRGRSGAPQPTPQELAELSRALQLLESAQGRPGVMTTVPDELTANLQTFMTLMAQEQGRLADSRNGTLEVQFDEHDILGWAASFFTWWRRLDPFDWQTPDAPETLPAECRVALFGDWGTGLYGAPICAKSIEKDGKYQLVLHLGDVYYSGTDRETTDRLVTPWPKVPGAKNRTLNGNHEMYTGGRAYFNAFRTFGQKSSYLAFTNDNWMLACLDTAYRDHDLHGDQVAWLEQLADASPQKRLVLFSHHQPYSLLDGQGPKLIAKLDRLFSTKRIFAWYWGHEHHCILYEPHALWGLRGRCVGHGGFPYLREKNILGEAPPPKPVWKKLESKNLVPAARVLDGINQYIEEAPEDYGPNGYMTLEFDGADLFEIVHAADGTRLWAQPLE